MLLRGSEPVSKAVTHHQHYATDNDDDDDDDDPVPRREKGLPATNGQRMVKRREREGEKLEGVIVGKQAGRQADRLARKQASERVSSQARRRGSQARKVSYWDGGALLRDHDNSGWSLHTFEQRRAAARYPTTRLLIFPRVLQHR